MPLLHEHLLAWYVLRQSFQNKSVRNIHTKHQDFPELWTPSSCHHYNLLWLAPLQFLLFLLHDNGSRGISSILSGWGFRCCFGCSPPSICWGGRGEWGLWIIGLISAITAAGKLFLCENVIGRVAVPKSVIALRRGKCTLCGTAVAARSSHKDLEPHHPGPRTELSSTSWHGGSTRLDYLWTVSRTIDRTLPSKFFSCQYLALDGVYHQLWAAFPNNPTPEMFAATQRSTSKGLTPALGKV